MKARIWQSLLAAAILVGTGRAAENQPASSATNAAPAAPTAETTESKDASKESGLQQPPPSPGGAVLAPNTGITNSEPGKVIRPAKSSLAPLLDQVVRMSEGGTDEAVLKTYIESAPAYRITGNEIIQLQDLGISQAVILALVQRSKEVSPSQIETTQPPAVAPQAPAAATAVAQPPATPPTDYYDTLSPYGTWYDVPGYGVAWQPTVVVVNPGWRPYCDYGGWLWSDYGWYWNSYYSWGWAPFHYGRWDCHPRHGWLWYPDHTWGAAWVSWRHCDGFYGWAPLPHGSHFAAGVGWTHHGHHVDSHGDFGLRSGAYTFVPRDHFADRHVGRSAVAASGANAVYRNSTVNNNHTLRPDNRVFNGGGVPRSAMAQASGSGRGALAGGSSLNSRGGSALATRNTGRSTVAGRADTAMAPSISAGRSAMSPSRPGAAAPLVNRNANAMARPFAPSQPVQPAMRQYAPNQSVARQAAPRFAAPQTMARATPSPVQRFGGGSAPMRAAPAAPQMPRYSAPSAAPRAYAPSGGRSFSGGGVSRGGMASSGGFGGGSRGGFSGGGGRH